MYTLESTCSQMEIYTYKEYRVKDRAIFQCPMLCIEPEVVGPNLFE